MAKNKEVYTIIRFWREEDTEGFDILGTTRNYSDAAKYIEDAAETHPYTMNELNASDYSLDDVTGIEIEECDEDMDIPFICGQFYDADCERCCRYRMAYWKNWTYAWFFIAVSDMLSPIKETE